jgi:flagellar export protein FliJ
MAPKFSLQTVLDVRHSRVEALEIELSELNMARREGEVMLSQLNEQQAALFAQLHVEQSGNLDLVKIDLLRSNVVQNHEKINQVKEALAMLAEKIETKRLEVVAARQAEETLAILKRKEIDQFNLDQATRDSREQDDIYISKAYRQNREEVNNGQNI